MEEHKDRALIHFLKRSKLPLEYYLKSVGSVVQDLKDAYNSLDPALQRDTDAFLKIMIRDGCFMLEILRSSTQNIEDYSRNDPIFSDHGRLYVLPHIKRGMLMLENQLPMLVLHKLHIMIVVDDTTESKHLNLIAFESFHVGAGNEVTAYVFFMDNIIDDALDIGLLHSKDIIQNGVGSDKAAAKLFNSMSKDVTLDRNSRLGSVYKNVND